VNHDGRRSAAVFFTFDYVAGVGWPNFNVFTGRTIGAFPLFPQVALLTLGARGPSRTPRTFRALSAGFAGELLGNRFDFLLLLGSQRTVGGKSTTGQRDDQRH